MPMKRTFPALDRTTRPALWRTNTTARAATFHSTDTKKIKHLAPTIYLLDVYANGEKEDLSDDQKNKIRELIEALTTAPWSSFQLRRGNLDRRPVAADSLPDLANSLRASKRFPAPA
jgi:hypothetical protein